MNSRGEVEEGLVEPVSFWVMTLTAEQVHDDNYFSFYSAEHGPIAIPTYAINETDSPVCLISTQIAANCSNWAAIRVCQIAPSFFPLNLFPPTPT